MQRIVAMSIASRYGLTNTKHVRNFATRAIFENEKDVAKHFIEKVRVHDLNPKISKFVSSDESDSPMHDAISKTALLKLLPRAASLSPAIQKLLIMTTEAELWKLMLLLL